jgi:outer membrane protein OmpA-like peptidoglycan-associated protein
MKRKKLAVIEIAGHTDDVGEPAANLILSQKRAESVRNYLISNGIKAERVIAKGYGEEQPIAANDTSEGRQINRRTEVRIVKELN